jgi:mono/diheme cytochrome c family protein
MPDFKLAADEAAQLAAFIRARGNWKPAGGISESSITGDTSGDPAEGRRIFRERGCAACHTVSDVEQARRLQVALSSDQRSDRGCLAAADESRGAAPSYSLASEEREALVAFVSSGELLALSLEQDVPVETAGRLVERLRCSACHARDAAFSTLSEVLLEEGVRGLVPSGIPSLTWAGEKLQRDWTVQLLAGQHDYRARPWLPGRMPAFAAYAERLATGLAHEHGYSGALRLQPVPDATQAEIGRRLAQQFTGFYCTECHSVGDRPPTSAFDHRGIDFPFVTAKLQYDYYHRWMRAPQRIDPSTKMPQFARQPRPDILEGDARHQFDALWHYLRALEQPD